jgi:hypothetical protein
MDTGFLPCLHRPVLPKSEGWRTVWAPPRFKPGDGCEGLFRHVSNSLPAHGLVFGECGYLRAKHPLRNPGQSTSQSCNPAGAIPTPSSCGGNARPPFILRGRHLPSFHLAGQYSPLSSCGWQGPPSSILRVNTHPRHPAGQYSPPSSCGSEASRRIYVAGMAGLWRTCVRSCDFAQDDDEERRMTIEHRMTVTNAGRR